MSSAVVYQDAVAAIKWLWVTQRLRNPPAV
jgi:hypothetical protein